MNYDPNEEDLRGLLREVRAEDEDRAPDFREFMRSAASLSTGGKGLGMSRLSRLAVAAALLIVLGGSLFILEREGVILRSPKAVSISEWKSPTESLLAFAGTGRAFSGGGLSRLVAVRRTARFTTRWSTLTASFARPPGHSTSRSGHHGRGTWGIYPRNSFNL